jgi:hypothetical protein
MPTFLVTLKHSPENCPMFNEKTRKIWMEFSDKIEGLAKKSRVKRLGSWTVPNEHLIFEVYDAPSLEVLNELFMEPACLRMGSFNIGEIKAALSSEEVAKMMEKMMPKAK